MTTAISAGIVGAAVRRPLEASKDRLRRVFVRQGPCVLLDSNSSDRLLSRFSVYAAAPLATFTVSGEIWQYAAPTGWMRPTPSFGSALDPAGAIDALDFVLRSTRRLPDDDESPATSGWYGLMGYDLAPRIERIPRRHPRDSDVPDVWFGYFDTLAVHQESTGESWLTSRVRDGETAAGASRRLERLARSIERAALPENLDPDRPLAAAEPVSSLDRQTYLRRVQRILEYIRAGDIFQANFAHRFQAELTAPAEELWNRVLSASPAPFSAWVAAGNWRICSVSPERFVRRFADGRIETRPIKGTRGRHSDPEIDARIAAELQRSPKDLAELTMIVDLERNDLGRICEYGSVEVERHAAVESFSNVHHLVSTVAGRLRPDATAGSILRAMFPGGSITGAPKIRAMEIIDELEACRRGAYTGAIGYFDDLGRCDLNIAIRTAVVENGCVRFHSGGGIVADSDPEAEYEETLAKARGLKAALLGKSECV